MRKQKTKSVIKKEKEQEKHLEHILRRYYSLLNERKKIDNVWNNTKENLINIDYEENKEEVKILRSILLRAEEEYRKNNKKLELQEKIIQKEIKNTEKLKKVEDVLKKVDFYFKKMIVTAEIKKNLLYDFVAFLGLFTGGLMTLFNTPLTLKQLLSCAAISFTIVTIMRITNLMTETEENRIYKICDETYRVICKNIREWSEKN